MLGHHKVLQVLVVCPDLTGVFCTLNKVPPLLQGPDDGKYLFVIDLVVPFNQREINLERKATRCHFSSSADTWKRMAPVAKLELLASIQKGLIESEQIRTGAAVILCLNLSKVDCLIASQYHLELFQVRSKSDQTCSKKSLTNNGRS